MNDSRYAVIMAGGRGERFWPQSRLKRPKHLLPIVGDKPMLAQTLDRLEALIPAQNCFIITNAEQREAILESCPQLPPENVVGEPVGRDTAAAVALATLLVQRKNPEARIAMLPADAAIHDTEGFQKTLNAAFQAADSDASALVTIGIQPTFPATSYGYLKRSGTITNTAEGDAPCYQVERFVEKPDKATAETYLAEGGYYWNAGMFIWQLSAITAELERNTPGLWAAVQAIGTALNAGQPLADCLAEHYPKLEKISIDYAVMEKARNVQMIPSGFDWDDVGEWPAIARHTQQDAAGNTIKGNALIDDGKNNIVVGEDGHLTVLIGMDDLIVVQTPDATLICPREKAQALKATVRKISDNPQWKHLA